MARTKYGVTFYHKGKRTRGRYKYVNNRRTGFVASKSNRRSYGHKYGSRGHLNRWKRKVLNRRY